jgi:hypothetical protein
MEQGRKIGNAGEEVLRQVTGVAYVIKAKRQRRWTMYAYMFLKRHKV